MQLNLVSLTVTGCTAERPLSTTFHTRRGECWLRTVRTWTSMHYRPQSSGHRCRLPTAICNTRPPKNQHPHRTLPLARDPRLQPCHMAHRVLQAPASSPKPRSCARQSCLACGTRKCGAAPPMSKPSSSTQPMPQHLRTLRMQHMRMHGMTVTLAAHTQPSAVLRRWTAPLPGCCRGH